MLVPRLRVSNHHHHDVEHLFHQHPRCNPCHSAKTRLLRSLTILSRISSFPPPTMSAPKGPSRRFSLGFGFGKPTSEGEAASVAKVGLETSPTGSITSYLAECKAAFLKDAQAGGEQASKWTVVLGNEAGGTALIKLIMEVLTVSSNRPGFIGKLHSLRMVLVRGSEDTRRASSSDSARGLGPSRRESLRP